ncbi:unnamed protein product, partial [Iphiclides podalirius]
MERLKRNRFGKPLFADDSEARVSEEIVIQTKFSLPARRLSLARRIGRAERRKEVRKGQSEPKIVVLCVRQSSV